jgi:tetratricopeptide (TPR) repeat protein
MAVAVNPYVTGGPVGGTVAFVGRADELTELTRALQSDQKRVAVLTGSPGIGRSSLLSELSHSLEDHGGLHPVRIDLHNRAWDPLDDVISTLADAVGRSLRITEPELGHWAENRFAERWLPLVLERIHEDDRIVFIFEEFPVVYDPRSRQAAGAFLPWFAGLLEQFPDRLRAVFTTDLRLPDQEAVVRRYFPDVHRVELAVLDLAAAWGLVRLSHLDRSLHWSNAAVERVLDLSGAHPHLTQLLCASVWDRSRHSTGSGRQEVSATEVDAAIVDVVDSGAAIYEALWGGLPPACRVVAAAVAWQDDRSPEAHRIAEVLHTCGVRVVTRVLEQDAPRELRRQGIFRADGAVLSFTVPLVRLWIRARRPLPDVLRDLDHIDPMAERLFQEAERLWQTAVHDGARRDAIAQLDEVLELNPNHAAATELLSVVHERRGDIDAAVRYLERLFEAQPARARPKLVRLLLQKAHEEEVIERRVHWYDRVLQVAPGHGEATRERARILGASLVPDRPAPAPMPRKPAPVSALPDPSVPDDPSRISDTQSIQREPPPIPVQPKWSPRANVRADDDRIDRLYRSGVAALEKGDRDTALIHLGRVAAERPTYRETTRHLYRAVHDVDPVGARPAAAQSPRALQGLTVVAGLLAAALLVSIWTRPATPPEPSTDALVATEPVPPAPPAPSPDPVPEPSEVEAAPPPPEAEVGATPKNRPAASSKSLIQQGWAKVEAGALADAEHLFDAAVTRSPRSPDAHYSLAYVAEKLGSADTAYIHYCSALQYAQPGSEVQRDTRGRLTALNKACN